MKTELTPAHASNLAFGVYTVNGGDERQLQAFLKGPLFTQSKEDRRLLSSEVGGRIIRSAKDVFGVCARGGGQFSNDIILVFRGTTTTNNNADFVTDARIGLTRSKSGWPVHIGFNHAFTAMLPELRQCLLEWNPKGSIHCVGHSLGGAVATLAADWAANVINKPVKLYTFGQPRVGLGMFSLFITRKLGLANIHRVFHTTDPVPMVPIFPYTHSPLPGHGRRVMSENPILEAGAHRMSLYVEHMKNKKWSDLSHAPAQNSHEDAIKAWLRSSRYASPNSALSFEWLERALVWLVTKQLSGLAYGIQWAAMGIHSFLDKVAWILIKGVEVAGECANYVKLFLRKVSQILGIPVSSATNLTHAFFRFLLETLVKRAHGLAIKAVRGIGNGN